MSTASPLRDKQTTGVGTQRPPPAGTTAERRYTLTDDSGHVDGVVRKPEPGPPHHGLPRLLQVVRAGVSILVERVKFLRYEESRRGGHQVGARLHDRAAMPRIGESGPGQARAASRVRSERRRLRTGSRRVGRCGRCPAALLTATAAALKWAVRRRLGTPVAGRTRIPEPRMMRTVPPRGGNPTIMLAIAYLSVDTRRWACDCFTRRRTSSAVRRATAWPRPDRAARATVAKAPMSSSSFADEWRAGADRRQGCGCAARCARP